MANYKDHFSIRYNQIIAPFGPGSIFEFKSQSFIINTIDYWQESNGKQIREPRLTGVLGVEKLLSPKDSEDPRDSFVKITRFPVWHFCSNKNCNKLQKFTKKIEPDEKPKCTECDSPLIPMRFVLACSNGHIQDVPWDLWVHKKNRQCSSKNNLKFYSDGKSGGLESLFVECPDCKTKESLHNITSIENIERLKWQCFGSFPWYYNPETAKCKMIPFVLQKGASNIHFGSIRSSIDIPPSGKNLSENPEYNAIRQDDDFKALLSFIKLKNGDTSILESEDMLDMMCQGLCDRYKEKKEIIIDLLRQSYLSSISNLNTLSAKPEYSETDFRLDEYKTFTGSISISDYPTLVFQNMNDSILEYLSTAKDKKIREIVEYSMQTIKKVVKIERLRVVTAFEGFSRLDTPNYPGRDEDNSIQFKDYDDKKSPAKKVPAYGLGKTNWLPAVENYGEGIFIEINDSFYRKIFMPGFIKRIKKIDKPPLYVLLHTLSHLLIRELAYECGYPSASIRERLYYSEEPDKKMAGMLLYTAAGDSQGSMGGLAAMADPEKFFSLLFNAVRTAEWCSNDPLCIESDTQGINNSNLAACHSCSLLPETSCENFNSALDRATITGHTNENKKFVNGIFTEFIKGRY